MSNNVIKTAARREYKLKGTGRVIVTPELSAQIDALHKAHPGNEWSGVLVFEPINDEITTPNEVVLKALAVFPMDFGSPGYTEYDLGEELLTIYDLFPEADPANGTPTLKLGQIHSHHTMSSFFSGTDDSELRDNAGKYDYYFSLIVNVSGQYVAKVAFEADLPQTLKVWDKKTATMKEITQEPLPILAVFDVNVIKGYVDVPAWFTDQIGVLKAKPVKHYTVNEHLSYAGGYQGSGGAYNPNMPYYASKYQAQQHQQSQIPGTNSKVGRRFEEQGDDYWNGYGKEYEPKKATEKEKSPNGTGKSGDFSIKSLITRESIRAALPFLFQDDDASPKLMSALLIIANHKLNQPDVTEGQRETWVAMIIGKLEYWMYEHFTNELMMNPDYVECDVLEQVYDIISICRSDSPIAITFCKALEFYIEANYPGLHTLKLNDE
jgi:hypothetical protein